MEPNDVILQRVRRAYELGRMRRGLASSLLALPMIGVSLLCSGDGTGSALVGALLILVIAGLVWRGGAVARGVLPGIVAGTAPLAFPLIIELGCAAPEACFPACIAGGVAGGVIIAAYALRMKEGRASFVLGAGAVAAVAGSLGCAVVGLAGIAAMAGALVAVSLPVALRSASTR